MMIAQPEARFLQGLARVASAELGQTHALTIAATDAATDPAPEKGAAVHRALEALPADLRDRLLAQTHRDLRQDLSAIWALLPGAALAGGMH